MHVAIRYLTTFTYDTEVSESHNALRACPAENGHQRLLRYDVEVDPEARMISYRDYWGTRVDSFGIVGKHTRLTVVADAEVETGPAPQPEGDVPLQQALDRAELHEYLTPTPHAAWDDAIAAFAAEVVAGTETAAEAATAVQTAVGERLRYETGSTEVGTSVVDVFTQRRGVCQDYAHLALAIYRSLGMPARYVSGYLYAVDSASGKSPNADTEIEVSTHAWVEVAIPGYGWWGLDPTNQLAAGERHVKIGHGRDYEDVTPLRGVYHGAAESGGLEASVKMSPSGLTRHRIGPSPLAPMRRSDPHQQQQQQQ
jgi:transglutaminase-like putative cysteine protease